MEDPQYLGNRGLMERAKTAFFASRKVSPLAVMPVLDWAYEIAMDKDAVVISGFQSPLEKEVLGILLKGHCGIIYVQNAHLYKKVPEKFQAAYEAERLLFASLSGDNRRRFSQTQADRRNQWIATQASSLVFASVTPESSLYPLYQSHLPKSKLL